MQEATTKPKGEVFARLIRGKDSLDYAMEHARTAPLGWRIRNALKWDYLKSWFANSVIAHIARKYFNLVVVTSELRALIVKANGDVVDYGVVSRRAITDDGVAFLVDDWDDDTTDITTLAYHGCGTGTAAAAGTDTNLGTAISTQARATGTATQPSANVLQTVATISFDASHAITEHGLFDSGTVSADDVMWDRHTFSAINVANGDSIQFTYQLTVTSSG